MTHRITFKIRYKPNTPIYKTTVEMDKDNATIEEIALAIAKKCAEKLSKKWDKRKREVYEFGHYKLILQYLEANT